MDRQTDTEIHTDIYVRMYMYVIMHVFVKAKLLDVVNPFICSGCSLQNYGDLEREIQLWIWRLEPTTYKTTQIACLTIPVILLKHERVYERHFALPYRFHQKFLHNILYIKTRPFFFYSDIDFFVPAGITSIKSMIFKNQMECLGGILRMAVEDAPKQLIFGELAEGTRDWCKLYKKI